MPAAIYRLIPRTASLSQRRCARCDKLAAELSQIRTKLAYRENENSVLRAQLANNTVESAAALATIVDLRVRVAELERSAKLNSENSSKPPSSDGIAKPERKIRAASQRNHKKSKPTGGQIGHAGATLQQVGNPDRTINHFPLRCDGCGAKLRDSSASGYAARQVFDLPEPRPLEVTEHRAHACLCGCGTVTKAAFPRGVTAPVQYGERVRGYAIYLNGEQLVPEDRVAQTMNDLFGMTISAPTVADIVARKAIALAGFMDETVLGEALAAPLKHMDETGLRVNKDLLWLHVVCTPTLTHYRVGMRGEMLSGVSGIIVHDFLCGRPPPVKGDCGTTAKPQDKALCSTPRGERASIGRDALRPDILRTPRSAGVVKSAVRLHGGSGATRRPGRSSRTGLRVAPL